MNDRKTNEIHDLDLLPNFCNSQVILVVILIAELLAMILTLSQIRHDFDWLSYLGYSSFFIQGTALLSAALLCYLKPYFLKLSPIQGTVLIYLLLQLVTLITTLVSFSVLQYSYISSADSVSWKITTLAQNLCISAIISAVVMRYFYVRHQWQRQLEAENQARIEALQARIRPHFLFNSLNTIASLVHDDPNKAESATLDLADLFRSTLADYNKITLTDELDIVRRYLRIEKLRLGDRLNLDWQTANDLNNIYVPALIIQPLVENAIYHGIEPLLGGGTITIGTKTENRFVHIYISNPYAADAKRKPGNQIALDNIRQRLALAYQNNAQLNIIHSDGLHEVRLLIPCTNDIGNNL